MSFWPNIQNYLCEFELRVPDHLQNIMTEITTDLNTTENAGTTTADKVCSCGHEMKPKSAWKNLFSAFSKSTEVDGNCGPTQCKTCSKNIEKENKKKQKEKKVKRIEHSKIKLEQKDFFEKQPLALKVTLPPGVNNSDLSVSIELQTYEGKTITTKKKRKDMVLICSKESDKSSIFSGKIDVPPNTNISKLANMPLYFVDSNGDALKNKNNIYTVFQPIQNTLADDVDTEMTIKDVHLKVRLEKTNPTNKSSKLPKFLSCSFVRESECPTKPETIIEEVESTAESTSTKDDSALDNSIAKDSSSKDSSKDSSISSSNAVVGDILASVVDNITTMTTTTRQDTCTQYSTLTITKDLSRKISEETVFPRSSYTTFTRSDQTTCYTDTSQCFFEKPHHNSPQDNNTKLEVINKNNHNNSLATQEEEDTEDWYLRAKQRNDYRLDFIENQRRVEEIDRTLQLLQKARVKLSTYLDPEEDEVVQRMCEIVPMSTDTLPTIPIRYHLDTTGHSHSGNDWATMRTVENPQQTKSQVPSMSNRVNHPTTGVPSPPPLPPTTWYEDTTPRVRTIPGGLPMPEPPADKQSLAEDGGVEMPWRKLPLELYYKTKRSGSEISLSEMSLSAVSKQSSDEIYPRKTISFQQRMKFNTIQNLYFTSKFSVEFDPSQYLESDRLYRQRYVEKKKELARWQNDLAYSIVDNDIKNLISDLLRETGNIKDTVVENCGETKTVDGFDLDELLTTLENPTNLTLAESEKSMSDMAEEVAKLIPIDVSKEEQDEEDVEIETKESVKRKSNIPRYFVNYCLIKKPVRNIFKPPQRISKLKTYLLDKEEQFLSSMEKSTGLLTSLFNELYGLDSKQSDRKEELFEEDFHTDKTQSLHEDTFESQYSTSSSILEADLLDKSNTTITLCDMQTVKCVDDEVDDDSDDNLAVESKTPSPTTSAMKSPKFSNITNTKNISEEDIDELEVLISTVNSTSPNVPPIVSCTPFTAQTQIHRTTIVVRKLPEEYDADETVIKETDLTKKNVSIPMDEKITHYDHDAIVQKPSQSFSQKSTRSRATTYKDSSSSTSDELVEKQKHEKHTQHPEKPIVVIKPSKSLISSDSEILCLVQSTYDDEDTDSKITLRSKMGIQMFPIDTENVAGPSNFKHDYNESIISSSSTESVNDSDYDGDQDNVTIALPNLRYRHSSTQELNSKEEIEAIEINIKINDELNKNKVTQKESSFDLNMDDSSSCFSSEHTSSELLSSVEGDEDVTPLSMKEKSV